MSKGLKTIFYAILIWAVLIAMIAPVFANDGPCSEQLPPASYVAMPAPAYELVRFSSQSELRQACGHMWTVLACALNDRPVIYMVSDNFIAELAGDFHRGKRWQSCLLTHEIAHLNGWTHD